MAFSHITIIYNPNSTGPSQQMAKDLAAELISGPNPVAAGAIELMATERAGHAEELAAAAARAHDRPLVVSSSGDGGYHEVVNGVMKAAAAGHPAVAAVLPAGNANDHRRTTRRAPLAEGIRAGRTTHIDLLRVEVGSNVRYAHSYLGLGLTPVVAAELNRHTLNAFRELLIVLRTFARLQPVAIRQDGRTLQLDSLILSNINQMAKALTVSQSGRPTDGKFEVTAFPAGSKFRLLARLLRSAVTGLRADARVTAYTFEVLKPMPIQLDGEVIDLPTGTLVKVTAAPGALETIL
jgi:diacylglycerol kinase (ATP)